jgi:hypothetical protein
VINVIAGGRLFPAEHHRALFDVHETAQDLHVAFASADGTTRVRACFISGVGATR